MNGTHVETIRDVSLTLIDLLKNDMTEVASRIALGPPRTAGTDLLLTLFLYKVTENPDLKNRERVVLPQPGGNVIQRRPPLTLDTYYLLTAHGGTDELKVLEAHQALGRAMRVFYDNGIIQGSLLRAKDPSKGLTANSVLRVTLNPISLEDMTRIWSVFPDTPYEISVTYLVTPVEIDSSTEITGAPVVDQFHEHGDRRAERDTVGASR
jgi:hypothetical protein